MIRSKREYKRMRPGLGTYVEISVTTDGPADGIQGFMTEAFAEVSRLEKIFNFHDEDSELSRLNRGDIENPKSLELESVLHLAREMEIQSDGAFSSRRPDLQIDLSGIAKGFIVDRVVEFLESRMADATGAVNAGGDLRFFGQEANEAAIRLVPASFSK